MSQSNGNNGADVSQRALRFARMADRLPHGKSIIFLDKINDEWHVTISREERVREAWVLESNRPARASDSPVPEDFR